MWNQRDEPSDSRDPRPDAGDPAAAGGMAEALSEIARVLQAQTDLTATLAAIVAAAVDTVPGVTHAGISLVEPGAREITTMAPTSDVVTRIDRVQYRTGQGPCVRAIADHRTYRSSDLTTERRWPTFVIEAVALGVRSMLSFRLFAGATTLGALNLYADRPYAFDDDALHTGELFAAHAAVALRGRQRETDLTDALHSRQTIGQATGILMQRYTISAAVAFQVLVRYSQDRNTKLRDIAAEIVDDVDPSVRPPDDDPAPARAAHSRPENRASVRRLPPSP